MQNMSTRMKVVVVVVVILVLMFILAMCGLPVSMQKVTGAVVTRDLTTNDKATEYWQNNPLTTEQLQELEVIMNAPLGTRELTQSVEGSKCIKLSKNFYLEKVVTIDENIERRRRVLQPRITWFIKGLAGIPLYEYKLYGSFWYDGKESKASEATATGSCSYPGWSKESSTAKFYGAVSNGTWFFRYYVGIAPVGMTMRTKEHASNIYVDKNGKMFDRTW